MPKYWKWMIFVPLWSSAALTGVAISVMVGKDAMEWPKMVISLALLVVLVMVVMIPLLILKQLIETELEEEVKSDAPST